MKRKISFSGVDIPLWLFFGVPIALVVACRVILVLTAP